MKRARDWRKHHQKKNLPGFQLRKLGNHLGFKAMQTNCCRMELSGRLPARQEEWSSPHLHFSALNHGML